MSLQVWLPLNGNLNNQGLSKVTITNNGATVDNNGKIGKCYYFNGSSYIRITMPDNMITLYNTSVCAWIKSISTTVALGGISNDVNYTVPMCTLYTSGWQFGNAAQNGYRYLSGGTIANTSIWHHVACTISDNLITTYLDGIKVTSGEITGPVNFTNSNFIEIGCDHPGGDEYLTGYVNDFRIYDHCLSNKEVEEIAKGLVFHLKLDDTYAENSNIISCDITETAYNAPISKYGYNDTSNLIKTIGNFQGKNCVKIGTRVAGQQACPYAYFGNLFTSDGTNAPAYKALSFDYYTTVPTTTWLNIYKLGSGQGTATWKTINSDGVHSGTYTNSANSIVVKPNEWNHVEVIFHGTTTANAEWGYCINGPNHVSSEEYYFLYANIQLEENNHVTGYGESMHSNIIYDSSGYNNYGEIINTITIDTNSPRYQVCTHFSATNQKIKISGLLTTGFSNSYTFAWWEKISSVSPMHWGFSDGVRLNGMYTGRLWNTGDGSNNPLYNPGTTTQVTAPSVNVWHHWAMVGNGTKCLVYQDGELWAEAKTYKTITGTTIFINGWDTSTSYCSDNASMSDFRLYSTALTAEQIKELYNTSATIDNKGNVYAREVVE